MSDKKKRKETQQVRETEDLYTLKTDAVDRLVNAEKKDYGSLPPLGKDPAKQYRTGFLDKIPSWVKAVFMKFWFNGAVCYFILWGLGLYIQNFENIMIILAFALGVVTDILVNNAFRFFALSAGSNDKWMMFPKKRLVNLFFNIIYSFVILLIVVWFYNTVNGVINSVKGTDELVYLGVEPILFGVFYVIFDLCFIGMKNLLASIVRDAKMKTENK